MVEHDAGVAHQQLEQLELGLGELDLVVAPPHPTRSRIDPEVAHPQDVVGLGAGAEVGSPEQGPQARQQLVEIEGLGQVVVGPGVEPGDPVGGLGAGGEHQDRRAVVLEPQDATHRQPIDGRHHHVEDDDIGVLLTDDGERTSAVDRGEDLVALQVEGAGERISDGAVVVDQEDSVSHGNHLVCSR